MVIMVVEVGQLQLNVFEFVIVFNVLQLMCILMQVMDILVEKCVKGIEVNIVQCEGVFENSFVFVMMLVLYIGYFKVVKVVKIVLVENLSVMEIVVKFGFGIVEEIFEMLKQLVELEVD